MKLKPENHKEIFRELLNGKCLVDEKLFEIGIRTLIKLDVHGNLIDEISGRNYIMGNPEDYVIITES